MGEHHALGMSRRARCRHDQRVAVLDPDAVGECSLVAVRAHDPRRTQCVEEHLSCDRRQPGVEWGRSIARVPDGLERIDEADATGQVECYELRHRTAA